MNPTTLNNLIPMEDPDGNRCFVNSWDVAIKKGEGWSVVGDLAKHTTQVKAPIELLDGDGKAMQPNTAKTTTVNTTGDSVAAERARVRAILKAADGDQFELADKLIAEGKTEAEALQVMAADRERRKAKVDAKGKPGKPAAGEPADATATPPAK